MPITFIRCSQFDSNFCSTRWVIRTRTSFTQNFWRKQERENYSFSLPIQYSHTSACFPPEKGDGDQSESNREQHFLACSCHMFVFEVFFMNCFPRLIVFPPGTFHSGHILSAFVSTLFSASLFASFSGGEIFL